MKAIELIEKKLRRVSCLFNLLATVFFILAIYTVRQSVAGRPGFNDLALVMIGAVGGGVGVAIIFALRWVRCPFCNTGLNPETLLRYNIKLWRRWPGFYYQGPLKEINCESCGKNFEVSKVDCSEIA